MAIRPTQRRAAAVFARSNPRAPISEIAMKTSAVVGAATRILKTQPAVQWSEWMGKVGLRWKLQKLVSSSKRNGWVSK